MSIMKRWRRWSARLFRVGCLAAAFGLTPALVWSQGADKLPPKHYAKSTSFHLPVQMTPATRADTREICLYVKQEGGDWVRQDSAPPSATFFTPKVSREGEYWFTLVTISKSGKATPADVAKAPPGLRVVVDMTAPSVDVQPGATPEGDFCLRCSVHDANHDPAMLKVVSRTDKGDRPLEAVPGMAGAYRVKGTELLTFPVRVTAVDRAGNVTTRDVNIREMVLASMKAGDKVSHAAHRVHPEPSAPPTKVEAPLVTLPPPGSGASPTITPPAIPPAAMPPSTVAELPPKAVPPVLPAPERPTVAPTPIFPPSTPPSGGPGAFVPPPLVKGDPIAPPMHDTRSGPPRQVLNTTQVSIDYRIDSVGPSGVGRVDVYLTTDNGQSWKKIKEDNDRRSPADIELPGEGLFGVKLVITNGNGFGGTPPVRGEAPTCWLEVDTTLPHITLNPIEPIAQNGFLELRWSAGDANLGAEPISLYFRTRAEAPWQPIARGLKNDGMYRWAFPRDLGASFWIKAEVTDQAGNVARAETAMPVVLDMTEPRASVLGISSINVRPTNPMGN